MNGILNLTLFTLLRSDWLNQRYRRQWRENTALVPNSPVLNFTITGTTVFYRVLFCDFNRQICKNGIKFRDSSVFDFILLFKKSELLKNSRQGTCTNLTIQIERIGRFSTPYMKSLQILIFFTTEGTKWNFLVKSFKFLGTSCTLLLLRVDYFISVIWIFYMGLTLLLLFFHSNSKNAKVKTREIKYQ